MSSASTDISTPAATDRMIFRKTNQHVGRRISVTPQNSTNRHLSYGRIILDSSQPSVSFRNGNQETGFIVLSGEATVTTGGQKIALGRYDAIYIPRDSAIEVATTSSVDIAESSSDVAMNYTL